MLFRSFWPDGNGEWQSVRSANAKFNGHQWPRRPLWGYVDEADPFVMEMEINAALVHGVNVFIYDWYWYDNRPFLENCLNNGFLKARNNTDMKFYLMWANHDAVNLWDKRLSDQAQTGATTIWSGAVDERAFNNIIERIISRYFKLPNYYQIDGCPVFMIYDIGNFIKGLGGVDAARHNIERFREAVCSAGFQGLHLQMALWDENSKGESGVDGNRISTKKEIVQALKIDSITHYQFVHFADITKAYPQVLKEAINEWKRIESTYSVPYFPHISIGWDNNPRFERLTQPVMPESSPENFKKGLVYAKDYLDSHSDQPKLLTINSWNEWTESSYLQPDDIFGYGYLEAIRDIFKFD